MQQTAVMIGVVKAVTMDGHCGYKIPMVLLPLGLVCLVFSLSSPYWIIADFLVARVHLGLWTVCLEIANTDMCRNWEHVDDWVIITRVLSAVSVGFCVVAVLTLFIRNCKSPTKELGALATAFVFLTGLAFLAGLIVFALKTTSIEVHSSTGSKIGDISTDYLSWAWYIGLVGSISCILAGIFLTCGLLSDRSHYTYLEYFKTEWRV